MGKFKPSGGITSVNDRRLDDTGEPNTRVDRYNKNGKLVQQRWYGPDGHAIWDRDWSHGGSNHEFPHDHYWIWNGDESDRPPYVGQNEEKVNMMYC